MISRLENKLLLTPDDVKPSQPDYEVIGVFNPGVAEYQGKPRLIIRVAEMKKKQSEQNSEDPREGKSADGFPRLSNISHFKLVTLSEDCMTVEKIEDQKDLFPKEAVEEFGIEDGRVTRIGDTYYMTYVSVSEKMGVATSLMSTKDFSSYERHGIIFPMENKDIVLFPEKVNSWFVAYHRPRGYFELQHPSIQIAYSKDLLHWGGHQFVMGPDKDKSSWNYLRIGAGLPPIKTDQGWLNIYHGVRQKSEKDKIGIYAAGAFLTPLDEPHKVIAKSEGPILIPSEDFEKKGFISEVLFPTGYVADKKDKDKIYVYYGCADSCIAVVKISLNEVLNSLRKTKP